jgi:hypothetical protein
MLQLELEGKLDLFKSWYRVWGGNKKGSGLIEPCLSHLAFIGCKQWQFTDINLFDINRLVWNEETKWGVIINHELVVQLMLLGVKSSNITFYSDCKFRSDLVSKKLNGTTVIDLPNDKKEIKRFIKSMKTSPPEINYVLNNVPFGKFKEFKELAETIASDKALIISGSRDYHNGSAFDNVELYKYLGKCFPTAKITASLAIVNPKGTSKLTVIDGDGISHLTNPNPCVTPGNDINIWKFAINVLAQSLPGYEDAEKGNIDRKGSRIDPNGIPVIFSAGNQGAEFDDVNRALTTAQLVKDNTKYCWATVDPALSNLIGGLGVHKVVVTHAANEPGHLGNPKYVDPSTGCGMNCWYIICQDKTDANECIKYLTHPDVVKLVKGLKSSVTSNSKAVWKKIPHHSTAKKWIKNYV